MNVDDFLDDVFRPTGDGDYASSRPCPTCGSLNVLLLGESIECLPCFAQKEAIEVAALKFSQAMDAVGELVRVAEGSAKAELHTLAMLWRVTVERWLVATGSARD